MKKIALLMLCSTLLLTPQKTITSEVSDYIPELGESSDVLGPITGIFDAEIADILKQKSEVLKQEITNLKTQNIVTIITAALCISAAAYLGWELFKNYFITQWKIYKKGTVNDTFNSIAGNQNAKLELNDIIEYLKNPSKYDQMGAHVPKGVLLIGPPGTGKTLLARAVAGEANCSFISVSGSEFIQVFVGKGAERIRSLFATARKQGPCIIFIDEIDSLIKRRDGGIGHDESGQTLNELLSQMDGFEQYPHPLIVIGATNRIDLVDAAAIRPGRFDRIVHVGLPTVADREQILAVHLRNKNSTDDINLAIIAQKTAGFSGAELANLINEAAIIAINKTKTVIGQADLEAACDKLIMGSANQGMMLSPEEKLAVAYHEAGHALMHILLNPRNSKLHKASIISRGDSGGHTAYLPEERAGYTKEDCLTDITITLGGRAAEAVVYNTTMTGPAHDLYSATNIAYEMVCYFGMSSLGPVSYMVFHSPETQTAIDAEIRVILDLCYKKAHALLTENKDKLNTIAHALAEKEELTAQEMRDLIA